MKTRVSLKYFVSDSLWKDFLILVRKDALKHNLFDNFGKSKDFDTVLT